MGVGSALSSWGERGEVHHFREWTEMCRGVVWGAGLSCEGCSAGGACVPQWPDLYHQRGIAKMAFSSWEIM